MTVSHSAQMLLKLEQCIPISHVTIETVPKYANIEHSTSSQLYASPHSRVESAHAHCLSVASPEGINALHTHTHNERT